MRMLYAVGGGLLSREELTCVDAGNRKDIKRFVNELRDKKAAERMPRDTLGSARSRKPATAPAGASGFVEVGIGKPLSIEIREVYTGKYPRSFFGGAGRAMLLTTAMKGLDVFSGAARAVNFLTRKVKPHTRLREVDATTKGTPVVYYSPALTQMESVLTLDIAFDEFPKEAFDAISTGASVAAGIPAFAAAGPYLVVGSAIVNLLGKVGKAGFDSKPDFSATVALTLDRPGNVPLAADYRLCMNEEGIEDIGSDYLINADGSLVRKEGSKPYDGDHPYVVLSIDGREHVGREAFTPTAATADMVKSFFGSKSLGSVSIEVALEGMKFFSDWQFRERALAFDRQLKAETNATKQTQLRALRNAAVKNIGKDELKPSLGG